jgi:tight adherence protein C
MRVVGAVFGGLFAWFASVAVWNEPNLTLIVVMVAFGGYYPGYAIKRAMEQRQIRIFRDLPYVLEMLMLSTEAGQDFSSAMATVIEKGTPGPLLEEFRVVHQEVTLGKTRADALRGMAQRLDLPEVTSFVLALIQAEQLGTSIGAVLRIMAEQMRIKRSTIAEELAGKVPVKLMAPLVACILPASFIILLFGPIYMYMTGQELGS